MKILVAGAAGFIGRHLVGRFLKEGHEVTGVDNLITGKKKNLEEFLKHPNFQWIQHDIVSPLEITTPLDWVLHFASPASPPQYLKYPLETLRVNSEGTLNLLEIAKAKGASFFLASTSEVYGDPQVHPQPENYWGHVNPIGPRSVYDEAKRYAEALVSAYHRQYKLPIRIIRIFNTYGPNMDPQDGRVVSNFITQALQGKPLSIYGDGKQTRSFQYIDDLVEGIFKLIGKEFFGPVNIGNPEEYNILELARVIKELTSSSSSIEFHALPTDDPKQRKPDIALAKELLHWEPKVSVKEGLRRAIEYFKSVR